jgi:hypothetical protein
MLIQYDNNNNNDNDKLIKLRVSSDYQLKTVNDCRMYVQEKLYNHNNNNNDINIEIYDNVKGSFLSLNDDVIVNQHRVLSILIKQSNDNENNENNILQIQGKLFDISNGLLIDNSIEHRGKVITINEVGDASKGTGNIRIIIIIIIILMIILRFNRLGWCYCTC